MDNKEIIISSAVLILLLIGFVFLMKGSSKLPNEKSGSDANIQENVAGIKTTQDLDNGDNLSLQEDGTLDNSGFETRQQLNQQATPNQQANPGQKTTPVKLPDSLKPTQTQPQAPAMQLKDGVDYQARFITSMGDFEIDLFEDKTPITVNNFVYLAGKKFYDGLIFHRVIQDFMIQGGDPQGTGSGGPGYSFKDEITREPLVRGSLAMANSGKNTNGSQFFIVTKEKTPWLDKVHTNFGMITKGLDVVMEIQKVPVDTNNRPLKNVVINNVVILEK